MQLLGGGARGSKRRRREVSKQADLQNLFPPPKQRAAEMEQRRPE